MNPLHDQEPPREQDFTVSVLVPTFRNENSLLQDADIVEKEQDDKVDAFLLYSNDEVRLRTLSGGIVRAEQNSTLTQGITRKTRISFELHPSVFMEELLLADDSFSDFDRINEEERINEEDFAKAINEDPQMYALLSSLYGGDIIYANIRAPRAA